MNTNNKHNTTGLSAVNFTAIFIVMLMLFSCDDAYHHNDHAHGHDEHSEDQIKGPHGGRLLSHDDFSLEITIYELGLPPEFRVYAYQDNKPVNPGDITLDIKLQRLGDKTDHIKFKPQHEYLRGDSVIYEPHSFEVFVDASYQGKSYSWQYGSLEGRTVIPEEMAKAMGIKTQITGPVTMLDTRTLSGRALTNPNRISRVRARFPGIVVDIRRELGDQVKAGDILATVQSNESLQNYQVKAPINGMIIKREIQVGEATGDEPLFIVTDLSDVWIELDVFVRDLPLIKPGQSVLIESLDGGVRKTARIDWVSPLASHASQSVRARATVSNADNSLRPGQFIRGHVTVAEYDVDVAVRQSALQHFRDFKVVFARFDDTYEVRMLKPGRSNSEWVEVLGGIEPGTVYVTENSYLIKADIEKSGASHDH